MTDHAAHVRAWRAEVNRLAATCNGLAWAEALKKARRWGLRGEDARELAQEAWLGLIRAAERYDPARAKYTTYATWWVRSRLSNWLRRRSRRGFAGGGGAPAPALVRDDDAGRNSLLDRGAPEPGNPDAGEGPTPADVPGLLRALDARSRLVVRLRFYDGLSLPEIGARLGVSPERARQLLGRALRTMRVRCRAADGRATS